MLNIRDHMLFVAKPGVSVIALVIVKTFGEVSLTIIDQHSGDRTKIERVVQRLVGSAADHVLKARFDFRKRLENGFTYGLGRFVGISGVVHIEGNASNVCRVFLVQLHQLRELPHTLRSPGGPQIDDNDFASVLSDHRLRVLPAGDDQRQFALRRGGFGR